MSRTRGARGKSTIEREVKRLRDEHVRVVSMRMSTDGNKKKLRTAIDKLHNKAESGNMEALRMIMSISRDLTTDAVSEQVARLLGAPELDSGYTTADAQDWILKTLPQIESSAGLKEFMQLARSVYDLAAEREKIAAMRQDRVPTRHVFNLFAIYNTKIIEVLSNPEHAHLLEQYLDLYQREILPRFPEVLELEETDVEE